MGFDLEFVVSPQDHYSEFVCGICLQLSEYPVLTSCSHVFCSSCLERWLSAASTCPACKSEMKSTRDLKEGSPLAWRVLNRVRCKCPLRCAWQGEYSELFPHMLSSESHVGSASRTNSATSTTSTPKDAGEAMRLQANSKYEQGMFRDSITLYSKAIALAGESGASAKLFANRAAAWMMVGAYRECIEDCDAALALDSNFVRAHSRKQKALCFLGRFDEAVAHLQSAIDKATDRLVSDEIAAIHVHAKQIKETHNLAQTEFEGGRPDMALGLMELVRKEFEIPNVQCFCARCELALGRVDRAVSLMTGVLKMDSQNTEALVLRGCALCWRGDFEQALVHIRKALELDPDKIEIQISGKKIRNICAGGKEAKSLMFQRQFAAAIQIQTETISTLMEMGGARCPLIGNLFADRGTANLRLSRLEDAFSDCENAINISYDCVEAHTSLALTLHKLGRHKEALERLEKASENGLAGDTVLQGAIEKAKFELRKSLRPNYYEILGVPSVASNLEIKAAYKKRALECHPDKGGDETEFKLLGEALDVLGSDVPLKRQLYDEGYDKDAIQERMERAARAARQSNPHHH